MHPKWSLFYCCHFERDEDADDDDGDDDDDDDGRAEVGVIPAMVGEAKTVRDY